MGAALFRCVPGGYNPSMAEAVFQILKADGTIAEEAEPPAIPPEDLVRLYRTMLLTRRVDERMVKLQRQGRIGFYIGATGEEATVVGPAYALESSDWIMPCYRELGAAFWRGYSLFDFFCQLFGNKVDLNKGRQMPNHFALPQLRYGSISSPVGTQIPQAAGMAMAARITGSDDVVLVYFGDGATSQGDFHVAANFAGVFQAPLVMMCRNNQWAISVPLSRQTSSESLAIKAKAYGFEGIQVDGNDLLGVISATQKAVDKARGGGGPTLIEALTYRVQAHSTSDDPRVYRDEKEVEPWTKKDPIRRVRTYLISEGHWDEDRDKELEEEIKLDIQTNLEKAEAIGPPDISTIVEDVYDQVPWHLREQLEDFKDLEETAVEQEV